MWIRVFSFALAVLLHTTVLVVAYLAPEELHHKRQAEVRERLASILKVQSVLSNTPPANPPTWVPPRTVQPNQVEPNRPALMSRPTRLRLTAPKTALPIAQSSKLTDPVVHKTTQLGPVAQKTARQKQSKIRLRVSEKEMDSATFTGSTEVKVTTTASSGAGNENSTSLVGSPTTDVPTQNPKDGDNRSERSHADTTSEVHQSSPHLEPTTYEKQKKKYASEIAKILRQHFPYPRAASRRGLEGTVVLEVIVDQDGVILSYRIGQSSEVSVLDDAALQAISQLKNVPKPPEILAWNSGTIRVPITYRLGESAKLSN
ncbi:MAG: energy transducer TonB [Myxococcales bacterium]|nr:energy transducer TonB [Myxococcales bacterium]